jgi:hypothetical protein
MTGTMPEEGRNPVEAPQAVMHLWGWFLQLNGSRQQGMNGAQPISNVEYLAFFTLEDLALEGWETAALRRLDGIALESSRTAADG